jgi:hypothetical protein
MYRTCSRASLISSSAVARGSFAIIMLYFWRADMDAAGTDSYAAMLADHKGEWQVRIGKTTLPSTPNCAPPLSPVCATEKGSRRARLVRRASITGHSQRPLAQNPKRQQPRAPRGASTLTPAITSSLDRFPGTLRPFSRHAITLSP